MALMQLAKARWQPYFDRLSKFLGPQRVQIETTGLGLGDQIQGDWIPLVGLSYDPKGDALIVTAEEIEHVIHKPRQIHVEQDVDRLQSIEAIDADGTHHILQFKEELKLPAA